MEAQHIILQKEYTREELCSLLQIKLNYWGNNKQKCLEYLGDYCEYEERSMEGDKRKKCYYIIALKTQTDEIPPMNLARKKKKDTAFKNSITKVIKKHNIQTMSNIGNEVKDDKEIKDLNYSPTTTVEYTRLYIRNDLFGTINKEANPETRIGYVNSKVWCRKVEYKKDHYHYEPMSDEDVQLFFDLYTKYRGKKAETEAKYMGAWKEGEIDEEEAKEQIFLNVKCCYNNALDEFRSKKGYTPIYANEYKFGEHPILHPKQGSFDF